MNRSERLASDPEWAAEYRRKARERAARRYADPEIRARIRSSQNARAAAKRQPWVSPAALKCTRCSVEKPATHEYFGPRKSGRLGLKSWCKECEAEAARAYRANPLVAQRNRDYSRSYGKDRMRTDANFRASRIAKIAQWSAAKWADPAWRQAEYAKRRARYANDPDYRARRKTRKPGQAAFYAMRRAALKRRALPSWADGAAIQAIYAEARRLTVETGVPHHVDHEIPLVHPLVCGLHVEHNLRAIPGSMNRAKSNRFEPA